jgi:hypothetical protein
MGQRRHKWTRRRSAERSERDAGDADGRWIVVGGRPVVCPSSQICVQFKRQDADEQHRVRRDTQSRRSRQHSKDPDSNPPERYPHESVRDQTGPRGKTATKTRRTRLKRGDFEEDSVSTLVCTRSSGTCAGALTVLVVVAVSLTLFLRVEDRLEWSRRVGRRRGAARPRAASQAVGGTPTAHPASLAAALSAPPASQTSSSTYYEDKGTTTWHCIQPVKAEAIKALSAIS